MRPLLRLPSALAALTFHRPVSDVHPVDDEDLIPELQPHSLGSTAHVNVADVRARGLTRREHMASNPLCHHSTFSKPSPHWNSIPAVSPIERSSVSVVTVLSAVS